MFGQMHETRTQWGKKKSNQSKLVLTLHYKESVINGETYCKRSQRNEEQKESKIVFFGTVTINLILNIFHD